MDDYTLWFEQFVAEWLGWEGLPGIMAMLVGLLLIFVLPLSMHQRGRQEQEVGRGFAFHFGAEFLAFLGLLLLLWGLLNYVDAPIEPY